MRIARLCPAWALLFLPLMAAPLSAQSADPGAPGRTPPHGAGGTAFGPLHFEAGGPLQRISYTPMTEIADPVPAGRLQAGLWMAYSNIFDADSTTTHDLYLDLERLLTVVGIRYGVADGFEVGARVTTATTGGGFLDGFLTAYHHLLHVGNADRQLYPENEYAQWLVGPRGDILLDIPRRTFGLEDMRLFAKWRVWETADGRRLVSLRGVARLPSSANRDEGERDDVALMALGRMSWTRWHLHWMLGATTTRNEGEVAPLVRHAGFFGNLAVERALKPTLSGVVQYALATSPLHNLGDHHIDGPSGNLVFGVTGSAGRSWLWDVSFQEDIPAGSPAADFTLGIHLSRRW